MNTNRPDILEEVRKRFLEYEEAINANDIAVLDDCFFEGPHTVRFGMTEELWSSEEIRAFRRTPNTADTRRKLERYEITTYGDSRAVASAVFSRDGVSKVGRQSQTWVRSPDNVWRVVAAHVSLR